MVGSDSKLDSAPDMLDTDRVLLKLRADLVSDEDSWKSSVLKGIANWPLATEELRGETLDYLIGGEAFDWRLLAQRLLQDCAQLVADDLWLEWITEPTMFGGFEEPDFMRVLGVDKFRAHLSYFYGVTVEQSLIAAVEEEITHRRVASGRQATDVSLEQAYQMLYGNERDHLWEVFKLEVGANPARPGWRHKDEHTLRYEDAFTYWLFKLRMERSDPAKIASDTRKGLAKLERMRQNNDRRLGVLRYDQLNDTPERKPRNSARKRS